LSFASRHLAIQAARKLRVSVWRRRTVAARHGLNVRADMQRLHVDDRSKAVLLAPCEKFRNRAAVTAVRVRVANVGDKEFPKARLREVTGGADEGGRIYDDRDSRRLGEFDTRVLLDLLSDKSFGQVLQQINGEAASGLCATLCLFPNFGVTDRIQKIVPLPAYLAKND